MHCDHNRIIVDELKCKLSSVHVHLYIIHYYLSRWCCLLWLQTDSFVKQQKDLYNKKYCYPYHLKMFRQGQYLFHIFILAMMISVPSRSFSPIKLIKKVLLSLSLENVPKRTMSFSHLYYWPWWYPCARAGSGRDFPMKATAAFTARGP